MYMRRAMVKVNKQICRNKHKQVAEVVILRRRERDRKRHTSFRTISKMINLDVKQLYVERERDNQTERKVVRKKPFHVTADPY